MLISKICFGADSFPNFDYLELKNNFEKIIQKSFIINFESLYSYKNENSKEDEDKEIERNFKNIYIAKDYYFSHQSLLLNKEIASAIFHSNLTNFYKLLLSVQRRNEHLFKEEMNI